MTTVLVIDTCSVFRFGIRALLESGDGFKVFTAQDHSFLAEGQNQPEISPDVPVLSSCLTELTLLELVAQYHHRFPGTQILALLNHENEADIHQLVESGSTSCALKGEPTEKLVQAVHTTMKGERYFSPPLLEKVVTAHTTPLTQSTPSMTKRELEVLRLVVAGKPIKHVAQILQISERTVYNYLQSIRTKLDVTTTVEAVFCATQLGILPV